jgi:putative endonuclease
MDYYVYMMASRRNGTLYVGVTRDLIKRVYEHKSHCVPGFTATHSVDQLVWFESTTDVEVAIRREKQIKNWKRVWKLAAIEKMNPEWRDLYEDVLGGGLDCGSSPQ